ncbi:hypothetical protein R5M92_11865 [Halomonas sp. Bachu 37]|uniref:hypothetical protein n=1 Tax=Halomonas kashgarensis TaxID=3084920 RepID=UPI003216AE4B
MSLSAWIGKSASTGKRAWQHTAQVAAHASSRRLSRMMLMAAMCQPLSVYAQSINPSETIDTAAQPFEARYRLQTQGWPKATVTHRLSEENGHWLSSMSFAVAIARANERSRFTVQDDDIQALQYSSSYSLLGIGKEYQLTNEQLTQPDRQTALFKLSLPANQDGCRQDSPCELHYLDHSGDPEHFHYYPVSRDALSLPAGEFEAVTVALVDPEKPDRTLHISFHPQLPGLLLSVEYRRDGRRHTQLSLLDVSLQGGVTP